MTNAIEDKIKKAKQIATSCSIALDRPGGVSQSHARSLCITVEGNVTVKHGKIIVPINIMSFINYGESNVRVVLDFKTLKHLYNIA